MAVKNEQGDWLNSRGKWIPPGNISKLDRLREAALDRMFLEVELLEQAQVEARKRINALFDDYIAALYTYHGEAKMDGQRNFVLTGFDGMRQAEIKVNDLKSFDESLHVAKALIDKCLLKYADNDNMRAIITEAFNVDKDGRFNSAAILGLTKIEIPGDADWSKACAMILASRKIRGSAQYTYFRRKKEFGDKLKPVNLNYSHK